MKNDTVKSAGAAAAKVYNKAVDIEQEYEAHRTTTLANLGQMLPESVGQSPFFQKFVENIKTCCMLLYVAEISRRQVLPKAKSALDTVVSVADNLNRNYGLTDKIDEKLQLSARAESLTEKFNAQKDKLTSKVDELKAKTVRDTFSKMALISG